MNCVLRDSILRRGHHNIGDVFAFGFGAWPGMVKRVICLSLDFSDTLPLAGLGGQSGGQLRAFGDALLGGGLLPADARQTACLISDNSRERERHTETRETEQ